MANSTQLLTNVFIVEELAAYKEFNATGVIDVWYCNTQRRRRIVVLVWRGNFSVHKEEAARIVAELDALKTIPILRKAIGLDESAHVLPLSDET